MSLTERGQAPIDYLTYQRAAEAIEEGENPYLQDAQSLEIFRYFHRMETELLTAHACGKGQQILQEYLARPQQPGPYIYPRTLALLISPRVGHCGRPCFFDPVRMNTA